MLGDAKVGQGDLYIHLHSVRKRSVDHRPPLENQVFIRALVDEKLELRFVRLAIEQQTVHVIRVQANTHKDVISVNAISEVNSFRIARAIVDARRIHLMY